MQSFTFRFLQIYKVFTSMAVIFREKKMRYSLCFVFFLPQTLHWKWLSEAQSTC